VERLREEWRARAAEHGLDREALAALVGCELERRSERRPAPDELTEQASTFTRRDVVQAVAAAQPDGAPVERVEALANELLARDNVVEPEPVAGKGPRERRFTTTGMLAVERGLLAGAEARRDEGPGLADRGVVDQTLDERRDLSAEQAEAVRALTRSGNGVQVLAPRRGPGRRTRLPPSRRGNDRSVRWSAARCRRGRRGSLKTRPDRRDDHRTVARRAPARPAAR
jgi:hypothetical protein